MPLDTSPDWMLDAARSVFKPDDLGKVLPGLPTLFATTRDYVLVPLIQHVFQGPDADAALRENLYRKLVGPWLRHEAVWKQSPAIGDRTFADLLDDPSPFYPEVVLADLKAESPGRRGIASLREWCSRYPRSTGPARHLASLLIKSGKMDEAGSLLDVAIAAAFHEGGRAESESLKRHLKLANALKGAQGGKLDAADELLEGLRADDGDPTIARQVINGFIILAQKTRKDPGAGPALSSAVESWAEAARQETPGPEKSQEIDAVRADRDKALVMIAAAASGGHTKSPDWDRIIERMTDLLREHPGAKEGALLADDRLLATGRGPRPNRQDGQGFLSERGPRLRRRERGTRRISRHRDVQAGRSDPG